jgi:hypothetical protein
MVLHDATAANFPQQTYRSPLVPKEQREYMVFDALNGTRACFSDGSIFDGR